MKMIEDKFTAFVSEYEALLKKYPEIDSNFILIRNETVGVNRLASNACILCIRDKINEIIEGLGLTHFEEEIPKEKLN